MKIYSIIENGVSVCGVALGLIPGRLVDICLILQDIGISYETINNLLAYKTS